MSAEDMTIDTALDIARDPGYVTPTRVHYALRVLAQAYKVEHALRLDVQGKAPEFDLDRDGFDMRFVLDACEAFASGGTVGHPPTAVGHLLSGFYRLRARIADLEAQLGQQSQIMREQGAELRGAEEEAYDSWCAAQDGLS